MMTNMFREIEDMDNAEQDIIEDDLAMEEAMMDRFDEDLYRDVLEA